MRIAAFLTAISAALLTASVVQGDDLRLPGETIQFVNGDLTDSTIQFVGSELDEAAIGAPNSPANDCGGCGCLGDSCDGCDCCDCCDLTWRDKLRAGLGWAYGRVIVETFDPCLNRRWIGGYEQTFLRAQNLPSATGNITFTDTTFIPALGGSITFIDTTGTQNLDGYKMAPRAWIGFENDCGRGARLRFWQFDVSDSANDAIPGVITAASVSRLRARTIDLELTQRFCRGCWDILGTVGFRNATLASDESLAIDFPFIPVTSFTAIGHRFDGTGLTTSLQGWRPLGNTGFRFAVNGRASLLGGIDKNQGVNVLDVPPFITAIQFVRTGDEFLGSIVEGQAGVVYERWCPRLNGNLFASVMFEAQHWDVSNGGIPFNFSQTVFTTTVSANSFPLNADFYGFAVGFGLNR